ncbi:hypothetical protein BDP81DRAFT_399484 [Colletotrichum phormii]|uniref:Uncharacterized protein n=1 Tax=Colletotrichum phormii TaxID=359342 RepID=A0AAJ0E927_9PEZI|nr:uncharacterized protein BDP81DRAFT_399484 [Colletotrichum phormii]KAK1623489.1 hypothetical protein BDP81DRAFT_399484 [Colletotrichum phormii]
MPYTGAGCNLVSASLASRLGHVISTGSQDAGGSERIQMANSKFMKTLGSFEAVWRFADSPDRGWTISVHVLEDCVYDLVLGSDFLRTSETMRKHPQRLELVQRSPRTMDRQPVLSINSLGPVRQHIVGYFGGNRVEALSDSGSESNLVSFEYVARRGLYQSVDHTNTRVVQFADGTTRRTMGSMTARWEYDSEGRREAKSKEGEEEGFEVEFHVLHGCTYDVIVGYDLLQETRAFAIHEDAFVDVEPHSHTSGLNLVTWLPSTRREPNYKGREEIQAAASIEIQEQEGQQQAQATSLGTEMQSVGPSEPRRSPAAASLPTHAVSHFNYSSSSSSTSEDRAQLIRAELERRTVMDRKLARMPQGPDKESASAVEREHRRQFEAIWLPLAKWDSDLDDGDGLGTGRDGSNTTTAVRVPAIGRESPIRRWRLRVDNSSRDGCRAAEEMEFDITNMGRRC